MEVLPLEDGSVSGTLQYSADLFKPSSASRIVSHYITLLESVCHNTDSPISNLDILPIVERQMLLKPNICDSQNTSQSIHEMIESQVKKTPSAEAVVDYKGNRLTYIELNSKANQLATHLISLGVGLDSLVGLCLDRSVDMIIGLLGILKAGGAYVPMDPKYPEDRLRYMLEDSGCKVVVTQVSLKNEKQFFMGADISVICMDECAELQDLDKWNVKQDERNDVMSSESLCYVIYTSGSTGRPKGVAMEHHSLCALASAYLARLTPTELKSVAFVTSICFDMSLLEIFTPLCCGGRIFALENALEIVSTSHEITMFHTVPTVAMTVAQSGILPSSVKVVCLAGEALTWSQVKLLTSTSPDIRVVNYYGPTETCEDSTWYSLKENNMPHHSAPPPIGRPMTPKDSVYVVDSYLRLCPIGVPGELLIGGAGVAREYLNRPKLTAEKFIDNPFGSGRVFRTGDLVRWIESEDGTLNLDFIGRIDHQVKVHGYRIELGEIESVLMTNNRLNSCVVIVREDDPGDKRLAAYVILKDAVECHAAELQERLRTEIPEYMVPSAFVFMSEFPLLPNGKTDRKSLPKPELRDIETLYVAPRSPTEGIIADIFTSVLGLERVSIDDDFFKFGGHSLSAVQVVSRLRASLSLDVGVRTIFDHSTVRRLSEVCISTRSVSIAPISKHVLHEGPIPLSFAQQRLWFLEELQPDTSTYLLPVVFRVRGCLKLGALQHAFTSIMNRHDVLRTLIVSDGGEPSQVIKAVFEELPQLGIDDLSGLSDSEKESRFDTEKNAEISKPFRLSEDYPIRMRVWRFDEEDHAVSITMHHIASDGWSIGILFKELGELYEHYSNAAGTDFVLPAMNIQYVDYALWEREHLQGEVLEREIRFWKAQLEGASPLELPTDRSRPTISSHHGSLANFTIPQELSKHIRELSSRYGVTTFMTMISAFSIMLARHSNQTDICIGVPSANRTRQETEGLIGFFVNTLVLRFDFSTVSSVVELLEQSRDRSIGAWDHQQIPFEGLVESLGVARDTSRNPLFQVMFAFQRFGDQNDESTLRLPGLEAESISSDLDVSKFDLTLWLNEDSCGELEGSMEYCTDLFDERTVKRMIDTYISVIESMVNDVASDPMLYDIVPQNDLRRLKEVNSSSTTTDDNLCIHEMIESQVKQTPSAEAVVDYKGNRLTYIELNSKANQLATHLISLGVGLDSLVGLCLDRSVDMIIGLLGILKAGGAYVPMDPKYPEDRLRYMLEDSGCKVVVTQLSLKNEKHFFMGADISAICVDECAELQDLDKWNVKQDERNDVMSSKSLCYVIYTSGSTGRPKGVAMEHHSLCSLASACLARLTPTELKSVAFVTSICFDMSLLEIFTPLCCGGRIVALENALDIVSTSHEITMFHTVPTVVMTVAQSGILPSSVKVVCLAGEALAWSLVKLLTSTSPDIRVVNYYGPTEACDASTWYSLKENNMPHHSAPPPIGRPMTPKDSVYVVDSYLRLCPIGVPGELLIGGAGVAREYLNRPKLTAEKFIENPFGSGRVFRTGDLVRWIESEDGILNLDFIGRIDHQVKVHGYRIELGEIESVIMTDNRLNSCVVIVREDDPGNKKLVAYVTGLIASNDVSELRALLKRDLPSYMVPSLFVVLDKLPLLANGKIDRNALPRPVIALAEKKDKPRTITQKIVADAFAKSVGLKSEIISLGDDFFEIGGHSLSAVRLTSLLREQGYPNFAVSQLFAHRTVVDLAAYLDSIDDVHGEKDHFEPDEAKECQDRPMPFWLFSTLQFFAIPLVLAVIGIPIGCSVLLINALYSVFGPYNILFLPLVQLAGYTAAGLWVVILKWIMIGRYKQSVHSINGWFFLRWWLLRRLSELFGVYCLDFVRETPLYILWLRLMGANVGSNVVMDTIHICDFDLIDIGDDCVIGDNALIFGHIIEDGVLKLDRVIMGKKCVIGPDAGVICGAHLLEGCELMPRSSASKRNPLPSYTRCCGSPAKPMGECSGSTRPKNSVFYKFVQIIGVLILFTYVQLCVYPASYLYTLGDFLLGPAGGTAMTVAVAPFAVGIALAIGTVLMKWILLGRTKEGRRRASGWLRLRMWLLDRILITDLVSSLRASVLFGTYIETMYLRGLGVHVGERVQAPGLFLRSGMDLICFNDDVILGSHSRFYTYQYTRNGELEFSKIVLEDRAIFGSKLAVLSGTHIEVGATVGDSSLTTSATTFSRGSVWTGCPVMMIMSGDDDRLLGQRQMSSHSSPQMLQMMAHSMSTDTAFEDQLELPDESDNPRDLKGCRYIGTRTVQILWLIVTRAVFFVPVWAIVLLILFLDQLGGLPLLLPMLLPISVGTIAKLFLILAFIKRIFVGQFSGRFSIWGLKYLIWSMYGNVQTVVLSLMFGSVFAGTTMYTWWFRMMGAKVGRRMYYDSLWLPVEFQQLCIGDDVVVSFQAQLLPHVIDHHQLQFAPLVLESRSVVGIRSTVMGACRIMESAELGPLSVLMKGDNIPTEARYWGNPCHYVGKVKSILRHGSVSLDSIVIEDGESGSSSGIMLKNMRKST